MRHTRCALALLSALFLLASVAANADVPTVTPSIDAAEGAALQWITRQMVPNGTVPDPSADRRRLLISYEVPNSDPAYRYIYGRSFIYDDALGVVALTMRGRYREAELLLNGLTRLVRGDGSLWFAYNTQNDWPSETDNGGAMIRTGSVAWVGYALTYYLTVRSQSQPDFATADLLGRQYRDAAQSIGRFVMSRRVTGSGDPREGLVTGGTGSSVVTIAGSGAAPAEVYDASPLGWVSTEHNIDAWFLLRDLGRLTGDAVWAGAARHLQDRLLTLWSVGDGQFYQGILDTRVTDTSLPLDGASWGALFLVAAGRPADAVRAVSVMEGRFGSAAAEVRGYRPYCGEPVYADPRVNAYYFPKNNGRLWKDLPFVWGEGSLGAVAALARVGKRDVAAAAITALLPLQVNGGFRYASDPVPYLFTTYPSVAATAWFIIAAEILRSNPAADLFWGP